MAVLVEAISVIVRRDAILGKNPGGHADVAPGTPSHPAPCPCSRTRSPPVSPSRRRKTLNTPWTPTATWSATRPPRASSPCPTSPSTTAASLGATCWPSTSARQPGPCRGRGSAADAGAAPARKLLSAVRRSPGLRPLPRATRQGAGHPRGGHRHGAYPLPGSGLPAT